MALCRNGHSSLSSSTDMAFKVRDRSAERECRTLGHRMTLYYLSYYTVECWYLWSFAPTQPTRTSKCFVNTRRLVGCKNLLSVGHRNVQNCQKAKKLESPCLSAFAKLLKATVSFVMSVHLSFRPSAFIEQLSSHWMDFHDVWCFEYVSKIRREKFKFH